MYQLEASYYRRQHAFLSVLCETNMNHLVFVFPSRWTPVVQTTNRMKNTVMLSLNRRDSFEFYLCWKNNECYANHNDHVELRRPNVRYEVSISDRWEGNDHIIRSLKKAQMTVTGSLEVLYTTHALNVITYNTIIDV